MSLRYLDNPAIVPLKSLPPHWVWFWNGEHWDIGIRGNRSTIQESVNNDYRQAYSTFSSMGKHWTAQRRGCDRCGRRGHEYGTESTGYDSLGFWYITIEDRQNDNRTWLCTWCGEDYQKELKNDNDQD